MDLSVQHSIPQIYKDLCKMSESPWRMLGFHEQLVFCIFMKSPPSLLYYVGTSICGSIYHHGNNSLYHHLKLDGATPRT